MDVIQYYVTVCYVWKKHNHFCCVMISYMEDERHRNAQHLIADDHNTKPKHDYIRLSSFTQGRQDGRKDNRRNKGGRHEKERERWKSYILKAGNWDSHSALAWREPVLLLPSLCFPSLLVFLILSFSLCVCEETFILETREREREILVVCLSPPHHGAPETKQARRVHIHTHL